ncbi:glycoside hydrolase family 78 protein [Reichenbachiella ulvae]|uniref:alpha-L-rhamnosidase n=1 Tax=Reichenbachiella ulvae TaxID=2980104 RepID=A0ABT3CSR1_9BACT|nr:glycoside hydrolase family 78 protein [Reichenbachiella ulvae]MCV9386684.1 glycoside hydrolase family 78 protein [Reichenbachiella ulvae]
MNKLSIRVLLFSMMIFLVMACIPIENKPDTLLKVVKLKTDMINNPIGIDGSKPKLSWQTQSDEKSKSQSAYQVLVASSPDILNELDADMWDSEKVNSDQSSQVSYSGKGLQSSHIYYWKVRIWDENGVVSEWSDINTFEVGLLIQEDWGAAQWIGVKTDTRTSAHRFKEYKTGKMKSPAKVTSLPVGYFRSELDAKGAIESARAYICGLGYYELYINGSKTGDHVLDPAPSNYDKQAYYVTYDVTEQLNEGNNALGIILGNGFYGQNISWKNDPESERDLSYGTPAVKLLLKVNYQDGSSQELITNEDWKVNTGPTVFDNIYGGDVYDARFELGEWNTTGFDDSDWSEVALLSPKIDKVNAQMIPPIRELKELKAQSVFKVSTGEWIVDFGQNIAGWVEISVQEKEGQLIDMIMTEALTKDSLDVFLGSTGGGANGLKQNLKYICKGEGIETWAPKFCYHGFRYAKISGLSRKPDASTIKAVLVATDIDELGSFESSEPLFNKMHNISKWTIVDNIHGIPEDCPHREKCGWLGDAHAFCEYALYNYEMGNFYQKYMEDIRTQMRLVKGNDQNETKYRVPTMIAPGKRTSSIAKLDWGIATMYLPWYNFRYYGDSSIVKEYYEDMKELTRYYLSFKNEEGIIDNGMGDWCPPRWDRRLNPSAMECHPVVSANAYFYDVLNVMEYFARLKGDAIFESELANEKVELVAAFNKAYLIPIKGTDFAWYGSQTATVMALQFGMVSEDKIEQVLNGLEYDIVEIKGGHHSTGIHGNRYIYTVLSKNGKADLAYEILTVPTFPSQTYVMNYGFTTWPERQFEWGTMEGLTNSLNHPMHSGFAAYFYECIGGVKSSIEQPGYKLFTVDPTFPSQLTHASVTIPTREGQIKNSWEMRDGLLTMKLDIPFNTNAKLILSQSERATLKIDGQIEANDEKISSDVKLGSGIYEVSYIKEKD